MRMGNIFWSIIQPAAYQLFQKNTNRKTASNPFTDVGVRTSMTVATETPVHYFYDAANRLTNVVQGTDK